MIRLTTSLVTLSALITFSSTTLTSQTWTACGNDIFDAVYLQDAIVTVGARGEVRLSNDRGLTWSNQAIDLSQDFRSMCSDSSGRLFAAASSGAVFRSVDTGRSWEEVGRIDSGGIIKIAYRDESGILVAVGVFGDIYTSNDGSRWDLQISTSLPDVFFFSNSVVVSDSMTILASGSGQYWIYSSLWHLVHQDSLDLSIRVTGASVIGDSLFICGAQTSPTHIPHISIISLRDHSTSHLTPSYPLAATTVLRSSTNDLVFFGDGLTANDEFQVIRLSSTDQSWSRYDMGLPAGHYSILNAQQSLDRSRIHIVGEQGIVAVTAETYPDENPVWQVLSHSPVIDRKLVPFTETRFGRVLAVSDSAVVALGSADSRGRAIHSSDNGSTWSTLDLPVRPSGAHVYNTDNIVANLNPTGTTIAKIIFIHDSLRSATVENVQTDNFTFKKEDALQAIGSRLLIPGFEYMYVSDDSGHSWRQIHLGDSIALSRVRVSGPSHAYCMGYHPVIGIDQNTLSTEDLYKTSDAGETWHKVFDTTITNSLGIYDFDYLGSGTVIAVTFAGDILRTDSDWETYSVVASFGRTVYAKIKMLTPKLGFALGFQNFLARTTDGGYTWEELSLWEERPDDRKTLYQDAILMPDNRTVFIVGYGIILRAQYDDDVTSVDTRGASGSAETLLSVTVTPNPVATRSLTVRFAEDAATPVNFHLYNETGVQVCSWDRPVAGRVETLELPASIASGRYFMVVQKGGSTQVVPVTIVR